MKLFKKLAAAVLVAALALMMVGCGGSKTGLAQQVKNAVSDDAVMRNEQATNSKDLDALAAKLLTEYNNEIAALDEGADWPNLQDLLDDETFLQKFGIDPEKDAYKVSLVYVPSYISDTMNQFKPLVLQISFGGMLIIQSAILTSEENLSLVLPSARLTARTGCLCS